MPAAGNMQGAGLAAPGFAYPDTARARQIAIFTLILGSLFLLDIGTTHFILWMGGVELNPLMAGIVTNPALHLALKSTILVAAALVALLSERYVRGSGGMLYAVLITLYIFIVVNNLFVLLPRIPL